MKDGRDQEGENVTPRCQICATSASASAAAFLPSTQLAAPSTTTIVTTVQNSVTAAGQTATTSSTPDNCKNLRMKLFGDAAVAFSVTFCVSPFTQMIDRAIVEQAAGKHTIATSVLQSVSTIVHSPVAYARSPAFLLMWTVFACTYTTANSLKTIMEYQQAQMTRQREATVVELRRRKPRSTRETSTAMLALKPTFVPSISSNSITLNKWSVFAGTTVVNSGLSLLRDTIYAQVSKADNSSFPFELNEFRTNYERLSNQ